MLKKPSGCIGCPFFDDGFGFVPDELHPSAQIAMVAQNPGDTEEQLDRPLIGRTGQMVQNDLAKFGRQREDASYLNIIKCRWRIPGQKIKSNVLPEDGSTHKAAMHCINAHLIPNLKKINPNVYVALGDLALYYMTNFNEVASWRGSVFIPEAGVCAGKKVLAMIHPAALYRDLSWRTAYKLDFTRLIRESRQAMPVITYEDNFRMGVTAEEFIATLQALGKTHSLVALDIETSKKKPIEAKLHTIGIAWSKTDAMNYFYGVDFMEDVRVLEEISRFEGEFVTATPFDYSVLTKEGVKFNWANCHDLTLLHSRFDIELPHDVGFVCSMHTNRPYWKYLGAIDNPRYNCLDCVGEWEAFTSISRHCMANDPKVWEVYEEDRQCIPVEVGLHLAGFPTSKPLIEVERSWYEKRRVELESILLEEFKPKDPPAPPDKCAIHKRYSGKSPLKLRKGEETICLDCTKLNVYYKETLPLNLRSRKRLMAILKKDGMKMMKDKETGKESLAKGKVADLYKKYGDKRLLKLLEFWEMDSVVTRYFNEAWITKETGRIHPTYSMHSAMHRWHCSDPNMQQQKKPEKEVIEIPEDVNWDQMSLLEKHSYGGSYGK